MFLGFTENIAHFQTVIFTVGLSAEGMLLLYTFFGEAGLEPILVSVRITPDVSCTKMQ